LLGQNKNREEKIALSVASSRITATVLEGGRIAYATLKIPLKMSGDYTSSVCNIYNQSNTSQSMLVFVLIVWDEASISYLQKLG